MTASTTLYMELAAGLLALVAIGFIVKTFFRLTVILAIVIAVAVFVYVKVPHGRHAMRAYLPASFR